MVNIGLGSDHAGFELKQKISFFLTENGFAIKDYGSFDRFSVDIQITPKQLHSAYLRKKFNLVFCYVALEMVSI
jgi:ribose 5-phosphate isomerase RpiB